ncbi:MAG: aminotransferase class V-fold PLP-dependent enzyme [Planctomycetes bacterium]|nr:aminotransferase class V-fold PLP-dependent enzyme [Planctomycetota bacterium]
MPCDASLAAGRRIYLDNAATSWPKPPAVYDAVDAYQRENGTAAGRGVYQRSQQVGRTLALARRRVAGLLGASDPARVLFTFNGTDSLNAVLHGVPRPGDHVVTSDAEHNSVLRPLRMLEQRANVSVTRVPCDSAGRIEPDDVARAVRPETRLLALTHASNVTGAIQPVDAFAAIAREHGVLLLIDAAQTAGHVPIFTDRWGVDFVAASGHKGLLGPLGTGILVVGAAAAGQLAPFRQGGTGTFSESDEQPTTLPERFESGNHNVPGLVGLERGAAFLEQRGWTELRRHEIELTTRLVDGLRPLPGVTLFGPPDADRRVGVVSFRLERIDPQELASLLDSEYAIEVRSGLHCAPRTHDRMGTTRRGGTVRAAVGPFNSESDVDALVRAVAEIGAISHV